MLVVGLKEVHFVSDVVVRYAQNVPVWVRCVVVIVPSSNHEVFPGFVESLYWDIGQEIIRK